MSGFQPSGSCGDVTWGCAPGWYGARFQRYSRVVRANLTVAFRISGETDWRSKLSDRNWNIRTLLGFSAKPSEFGANMCQLTNHLRNLMVTNDAKTVSIKVASRQALIVDERQSELGRA